VNAFNNIWSQKSIASSQGRSFIFCHAAVPASQLGTFLWKFLHSLGLSQLEPSNLPFAA